VRPEGVLAASQTRAHAAAPGDAATLADVVGLAVPWLADWAAVEIGDGARRVVGGDGPPPAEPVDRLRIPIVAAGTPLGELVLLSTDAGRRYGPEELGQARQLAAACALAVENARLSGETRDAEARIVQSMALLETLFHNAPVGLAFFDRELRFVRINERMAEFNGLPVEDHLGRRLPEVLPHFRSEVVEVFEHVLRAGEAVEGREIAGASRERRDAGVLHWVASYYPVKEADGTVVGIGAVVIDNTERRRAHDRATLLARASALLDESLDLDVTLQNLGRVVVPDLADWFAVDLIESGGAIRRAAIQHADPERIALARGLAERFPSALDDADGAGAVIATGQPSLEPSLPEDLVTAGDPARAEFLRIVGELGLRSSLIVPLRARGRILGALSFVQAESGRRFGEADLVLAEELAGRCALAIDNSRLLAEAREAQQRLEESLALLDTLFATAPVGLAFFDPDLRYVTLNDKLAEINGLPASEHVGRTVGEVLPDMDPAVVEGFRRVMETGEAIVDAEVAGQTPAQPGRTRHWMGSWYPVHDRAGRPLGLGAVVTEVTERKRAERERERLLASERRARTEAEEARERAAFLAEVSGTLDESLDVDVTLRRVGGLVVPALADWFAVDVLEPDAVIRRVAVTHTDPERERMGWALAERFPASLDDARGFGRSIRTGCSELLPDIPRRTLELVSAGREGYAQALAELGLRSSMIIPLKARGRTLGAMLLAAAESGRRFGHRDLALAEELGGRIALAMDNARLYKERADTARMLQASLLPPEPPSVPGLELAACYRAAGEGNEVGGDFYDVFPTGGDSWGIFLGDVCGKGPAAAAVTALARYTLRAAALHASEPSGVLRGLNDAMLRQHKGDEFCTAAYVRIDGIEPERVRLTLAVAGHPPPVIVREGGAVEPIRDRGTLLGVVDDPVIDDVGVTLGRGDVLLLYTDGVTEARVRHWELGEEGLISLLGASAGSSPREIVEAIEETVVRLQGGEPRDDIALIALRPGA